MRASTRTFGIASLTVLGGLVSLGAAAAVGATSHSPTASAAPTSRGTIKIDGASFDDSKGNEPHVGCSFRVSFWGFEAGTRHATVGFDAQPPSKTSTGSTAQPVAPVTGRSAFTFTGSGKADTLDHSETYSLNQTGLHLQPNQGYHIKVTATVDQAKGKGVTTKHKVFWMSPCAAPSPSPSVSPTSSPSASPSASRSVAPSVSVSPSVNVLPTSLTRTPQRSPSVLAERHVRPPTTAKNLPFTGVKETALLVLGTALLCGGAALMVTARRRGSD